MFFQNRAIIIIILLLLLLLLYISIDLILSFVECKNTHWSSARLASCQQKYIFRGCDLIK